MKTLSQSIFESRTAGKHFPSTAWMVNAYSKFNRIYFNNELPKKIILEAQDDLKKISRNTFGCFGFSQKWWYKRNSKDGMQKMLYANEKGEHILLDNIMRIEPHIYLNKHIKFTFNDMEDTMIHEMVHLWTFRNALKPVQAHGTLFRQKCDEIRQKAKELYNKDYELTIYGDMATHEVDENIQDQLDKLKIKRENRKTNTVVIYLEQRYITSGQNRRIIFCSKNMLSKMLDTIKTCAERVHKDNIKKLIYADDVYRDIENIYGKFPVARKYKYYYANEFPEIQNLIESSPNVVNDIISEGKKEYVKPEISVLVVPANFNLSTIDDPLNITLINDEEGIPDIPDNRAHEN